MIVADRFVYLRFPKTGSTFMAQMLARLAQARPDLGIEDRYRLKHRGLAALAEPLAGREVVTNCRSPFERYLSNNAFRYWKEKPQMRYRVARARACFPHFPICRSTNTSSSTTTGI